jgi:hypothetical protein
MTDVRTELRRASRLIDVPDGSFEHLVERRQHVRRRGRVASLVVALSVAAAVVGGGLFLLSGISDRTRDAGVGWQPSRRLELLPGEYFYLRVTSDEAVDGHISDLETWWAPDGSGEVRNRSTRQDKYPYPPSGVFGEDAFPVEIKDVVELSTNADELAAMLRGERWDWAGPVGPARMFKITALLSLEAPYATPQLRAALLAVQSAADGVTIINDARDPAGRSGIALEMSELDGMDTATWRMYFDPGTHQALAWTFESTRGGSAWILLESAIVDAPGEAPEQDEWLVPPVEEVPASSSFLVGFPAETVPA